MGYYCDEEDIQDLCRALTMVFWGGLICIIDFKYSRLVNGQGFTIDIISDTVGMILITIGVFKIAALLDDNTFKGAMLFIKIVAILGIIETIHNHFVYEVPRFLSYFSYTFGLLTLAAIVLFLFIMRYLSNELEFDESRRLWTITIILVVIIYVFPLGFININGIIMLIIGRHYNFNLGSAGLLTIPVFIIPFIFLLLSALRMKKEAEFLVDEDM